MTEIFGNNYTTLTNLVQQIRLAVNDTTTGVSRKWSDDQVYLAIKASMAQAGGAFLYEDIYEDLDFAASDVDYTLPEYVQRVIRVERERSIYNVESSTGTTLDWEELKNWRQVRTPGNNRLLLNHEYPAGNVRVVYERDVQIPVVDLELAAAITTTAATTMTVTFPGTYNIYDITPIMYFEIDNAEIVKCTATAAPSTLTIARGQLGTTALATAVAADVVSPIIFAYDSRFALYIVNAAAAYLNMLLLQDTNRGSDVAGNLTAMREFRSLAESALRRKSRRQQPRRLQAERVRRGGLL